MAVASARDKDTIITLTLPRWLRLNFGGVVLGLIALALSVTPSLVPRPPILQGALAGLSFGIAYGIGVLIYLAVNKLSGARPTPRARRIAWLTLGVLGLLLLAALMVAGLLWQNEVRALVEMPPLSGVDIGALIGATVVVAALSIAVGRLVRRLYFLLKKLWRSLATRQRWAQRIAPTPAAGALTALSVVLVGALLLGGGMALIDSIYLERNSAIQDDITEPDSRYRSAGSESPIEWAKLGRHGRAFVGGGPSAEQIEKVTGEEAQTPVRVYVGMAEAPSLQQRAQLAVAELTRTGAFERKFLVVATSTGSGWLEPQTVDALEYLQGGDTAIVSMQYAYTPSWVSFLFDQDLPMAASEALFEAVEAEWLRLPADDRPQLIAYGLSLGAHGIQSVFADLDDVRSRTDGALFVGSPNGSELWNTLQNSRDAGSPVWQPVLGGGSEVRWFSQRRDFATPMEAWQRPRVAYLQHATDPVTWLSPRLIWQSPEWLEADQRGADVSPSMRWIPLVTALQVLIDMLMGESVPANHGHNFGNVVLDGWRAVTPDGGLSEAAVARIQTVIEGYADESSVSE